jgi:hypothetical protein
MATLGDFQIKENFPTGHDQFVDQGQGPIVDWDLYFPVYKGYPHGADFVKLPNGLFQDE